MSPFLHVQIEYQVGCLAVHFIVICESASKSGFAVQLKALLAAQDLIKELRYNQGKNLIINLLYEKNKQIRWIIVILEKFINLKQDSLPGIARSWWKISWSVPSSRHSCMSAHWSRTFFSRSTPFWICAKVLWRGCGRRNEPNSYTPTPPSAPSRTDGEILSTKSIQNKYSK